MRSRPPVTSRRAFLRASAAAVALAPALFASGPAVVPVRAQGPAPVGPDEALQRLLEGNQRFVAGQFQHDNRSEARRQEVAAGQRPFAAVLACADSRVAPELVFDAGLGELFVTRVAGNIAGPGIIGSIEYAVGVLGTPLVLVLGHSACGAVEAAIQAVTSGAQFGGDIATLVTAIAPAVALAQGEPGDLLENATRANARLAASRLATANADLVRLVSQGALRVAAGYYDLQSGRVTMLS
ncbi:MAG TPA: carbonic anhydrase [Chloroflexota bacterium]|nr:carbonic anhydrase [Chloroflexota bacterium]